MQQEQFLSFLKRFVTNFLYFCILPLLSLVACSKATDHPKFKMPKMPYITAENLHSVVTIGDNDVWIVGDFGTVFHSCNDGASWEKQETGTENNLIKAYFTDNQTGWICGILGIILHTSDGGKTWVKQNSGTGNHLFSLCFPDSQNGWAIGDMGTVLVTADGGITWSPNRKEADITYKDVFFTDPKNGWIVGEFGTILHTSDRGKTWKEQTCKDLEPPPELSKWAMPKPYLFAVFFKDQKRGWIAGITGIILATEDGGVTWRKITSNTNNSLYSIYVHGEQGWAVGAHGLYLVSADGGRLWNLKEDVIKTRFWLNDFSFRNDGKDGFVIGARGAVAQTRDSGNTWKILSGISYEMPEIKMSEF